MKLHLELHNGLRPSYEELRERFLVSEKGKMKKPKVEVKEHEVWCGERTHRRVCGILPDPQGKPRVYYSNGGDTTLSCSITRFRTWVRQTKASCVNKRAEA